MKSLKIIVLRTVAAVVVLAGCVLSQVRSGGGRPVTRFTCQGRPMGYYADVDTGCQVYHMCDGMGRQFSYTCPNTTLFQQRMLVCDHWYMVNCSRSESEYGANLLIGQRDKPFVSEAEMHMRTPRPDILTVPYNNNYYDGLKQAETKYPTHPSNSIVIRPDSQTSGVNGNSDDGKTQFTYRPQSSQHHGVSNDIEDIRTSSTTTGRPTFNQQGSFEHDSNSQQSTVNGHFSNSTVRSSNNESDEFDLDIRMKDDIRTTTATFNFIKRFDPRSSPTRGTAMTTSQILDINRQLPASPDVSSDDLSKRKSGSVQSNFNTFHTGNGKSGNSQPTIRKANTKSSNDPNFGAGNSQAGGVVEPQRELQPPKTFYSNLPSTTMGPPIYYEWKWAVPAFDLEPPKSENETKTSTDSTLQASESGRTTFRNITRTSSATPRSLEQPSSSASSGDLSVLEYNPSSYFVPDYIFPLDSPHPGYQEPGAQTSFQVYVPDKGSSYGENPKCPQCHPAYVKPGTCEPCVEQR